MKGTRHQRKYESFLIAFILTTPFLTSPLPCFLSSAWSYESVRIPNDASDSDACGIIERAHARGIEIWRSGQPADALEQFKACEAALKKRSLWIPPKLPEKASEGQKRALRITNQVIFSLASVYQRLGRHGQSEWYADMARERGLLPKVITSGRKRS